MFQTYIAHRNEKTKEIQTIKEHSENTARLCCEFSISSLKDVMYIIGIFHDIGKYQLSFQKRINDSNIRVEHSTCGALAAQKLFSGALGLLMEYCIAGHHSGLPDAGNKTDTTNLSTLYGRMSRKFEDYSTYENELTIPDVNEQAFVRFLLQDCEGDKLLLVDKFAFFTRYCFSCLVDADSLDTTKFCKMELERQLTADFYSCLEKVNEKLDSFVCKTSLQKSRSLLQNQVFEKTDLDAEIYLMNMPTGSGKTLASIKFALERVVKKNKKRIIYIIPFNSIIDQVADEFEKMFQECGELLRHQSTFSYESEDEEKLGEDYVRMMRRAAENWDAPLIITTMVQFFQSLYDNKRGKLRKLHNMSDSILVFDEAHLMPLDYLQPCLRGIAYITRYLNSEAVFLTATMPDFPKLMRQYALKDTKMVSLIEDTSIFSEFQKCKYHYVGEISQEGLLLRAMQDPSSLIIVNSRAKARKLYKQCGGKKYHLSTYMTAYDRKRVLTEIKNELHRLEEDFPEYKNVPENRRVRIISTSLIEAGVDLDVYTVFRELNGLDNILQAGGRCNREGKRQEAEVILFELEGERANGSMDERGNMVRGILKKYKDISCPQSIREYYERLYSFKSKEIQRNMITRDCHNIESIPFKKYAEEFEVIDFRTVSIVVPRDEMSRELVKSLPYTGAAVARKLQMYTCSVYINELNDLIQQHVAEDYDTGIYCLTNLDYYSKEIGLLFEATDYYED